jgi:carbonic anhydrase
MSLLNDILEHNARFVTERNKPLTSKPKKKVAIFTCMDTRLVDFLEQAMGLGRGDAKMLKNAGNTLIDPQGGMIRSLVVAVYALGCEEVLVIGHTDCGMSRIDENRLEQQMIERGVDPAAIHALQPSLREWIGAFHHPVENVQDVVGKIRTNALIPQSVPVHGLIFDPNAGKLTLLSDGYAAAGRNPDGSAT